MFSRQLSVLYTHPPPPPCARCYLSLRDFMYLKYLHRGVRTFGAASLFHGKLRDLCNTNSCFSTSTSRNWQEKLALTEKRKLEEAEKLKVMRM